MKKLFLLFATIMSYYFGMAEPPSDNAPITYTAVEQVEDVDAVELFARAQTWLAQSYNSGKHVLQMSDNNRLVGKANYLFKFNTGFSGDAKCKIKYTITIECRDGRYKYTIDDIQLYVAPPQGNEQDYGPLTTAETLEKKSSFATGITDKRRQELWRTAKENMNNYISTLVTSLKVDMAKITTNNEW